VLEQWLSPDATTVTSLLKSVANAGAFGHGTKIHGFFLIHRLAPDAHTETALGHGTKIHRLVPDAYTALVDMYAKCGRLDCAQKLLDGFEHRNLATWNLLVAGHTNAGEFDIALEVVETMTRNRLDSRT
jgi:pentatricopeptide repeat protein